MSNVVEVRVGDVPKPWRRKLGLEGRSEDERVRVAVEDLEQQTRQRLSARDMIGAAVKMGYGGRDPEEINDQIRSLRDEWDK